MSKFSNLRQLIQFAGLAAGIFILSCGQLKTARYVPQGEYAQPSQYMTSSELKRPTRRKQYGGPFRLTNPVDRMKFSRGFRKGRKAHHGIDIVGRKNTPIRASHAGVVVYAGQAFRGYGKMVIIEYNDRWATLYAHLNRFNVRTGDEVYAGQVIGGMGSTGRSTGVHLHFELLHKRLPIDPLPYLEGKNRISRL